MVLDAEIIQSFYSNLPKKIREIRQKLQKPMTLSEKILYIHSHNVPPVGAEFIHLSPDRVTLQDAAAQMPLLQFATSGLKKTSIPTSVHCDQLITAEHGAKIDLEHAKSEHQEIYDFLQNSSSNFGIGFWKPGSGDINQVILENYAFPGGLLFTAESHGANSGGLCSLSFESLDVLDAMTGMGSEVKIPQIIGIHLTGTINQWVSSKDVSLKLASMLANNEASGCILEYFGEGTDAISTSARGIICSIGEELGAVASIFPYDKRMADYLKATGRDSVASMANSVKENLVADPEVYQFPTKYFSKVIEINLSELEPQISGSFTPDKTWNLSDFAHAVRHNGFTEKLSAALIGSYANASYEDFKKAAHIARQAHKHGFKAKCLFLINPGSEMLRSTLERDGIIKIFEEVGGIVLANSGGPSIGHWKRHDVTFGEKNSILTTHNRNFSGCNDGNPGTQAFIANPEIVTAMALAGKLTFNPMKDPLINEQGLPLHLEFSNISEFPEKGFNYTDIGYIQPSNSSGTLSIDPNSKRLQMINPFTSWGKNEFNDLRILMKVVGKCSVDHISPANKWMKFRGHLENMSESLFHGASNAFREEIGRGKSLLSGEIESFAKIAKEYKVEGIGWIAVGEENYGEGVHRDHSAMQFRHLGGRAIIAKSFAKHHETNLKKQGILTLTFANPADYQRIHEDDLLDIVGLENFSPVASLELVIKHVDGKIEKVPLKHSFNELQVQWFKSGSALEALKK